MKRRLIALLLCIAMIGSMTVYAVGDEDTTPVCTCGTENEEHTSECALYVAPEAEPVDDDVTPEPTCTCGTETDEHTSECALYVAPVTKCEHCGIELTDGAVHLDTCLTLCTCEPVEGVHQEGCKFYVKTIETCEHCGVELTEEAVHTEECPLYEAPGCTCGTGTDYHDAGCPLYVYIPPINYTNVGPLMPPVVGQSKLKMMFKSSESVETTTRKDAKGLETTKSVTKNADGTYTLTLEAWATGETVTTITQTSYPTDIILVLDQSGSMTQCMCGASNASTSHAIPGSTTTCTITTQRLSALKSAAGTFVNNVIQSAEQNAVSHRIAVVGFGDYDTEEFNFNNTEILSLESEPISIGSLKSQHYQAALQNVTDESGKKIVRDAIKNLGAAGMTATAKGLEMACKIFEQNSVNAGEERNRVVVLFTDGEPTDGWDNGVQKAYQLKNTYGATVYSVGVVDDANPSDTEKRINKYLNYISSNFPNANSWDQTYERTNNGYYLTAGDADILDNIFQNISQEITQGGASIQLDENAVVKDVISEYFQLPEDASKENIASYVKVYAPDYNGNEAFDEISDNNKVSDPEIILGDDGKTISVTNFDFAENWVGANKDASGNETDYHGKKLVIQIPIKARDGFLGGNGVPTNDAASGIYENNEATEPLEQFTVPKADVEIPDILFTDPNALNKNVYLMGNLTEDELTKNVKVKVNETELLINEWKNVNEWKDDYTVVTIVTPDALRALKEDTTTTYSVTIAPTTTGTVTQKTATANGNIHVFKPTVTFRDGTVKYMNSLPTDFSGHIVSTDWKHDTTLDTEVSMTGEKPTLTFTYVALSGVDANGKVTDIDHVPMNVSSVKIEDTDVTTHVFFGHQACDPACEWNNGDNSEFWLHVINDVADLIISKTATGSYINNGNHDQIFIFEVYQGDKLLTTVALQSGESVTIKDLTIGTTYTVKEVGGWSWRFDATEKNHIMVPVTDTRSNPNTVAFTNNQNMNLWLTDDAFVLNKRKNN